MPASSRLAALLALAVTLVSAALVLGALATGSDYADSRLLDAGWVVVPAVGAAAYLGLRWGLAAAAGALAAPAAGAVAAGTPESGLRLLTTAGALAIAVLVGQLVRLADQRDQP